MQYALDTQDYPLLAKGPFSDKVCTTLFKHLIATVPWHEDSYVAFERRFSIPRLQAWYADDGIQYSYVNNLLTTLPWTKSLQCIREMLEKMMNIPFNAVLLTYYRNGYDYVDWHADDELELGENPVIASLSLGAARLFQFRHQYLQRQEQLLLHHGDLLIMQPNFQKHWQHRVPEDLSIIEPRINLTFRQVVAKD